MDKFVCLSTQGAPLTQEIVKLLLISARTAILYMATEALAFTDDFNIEIETDFRVQRANGISGIQFKATVTPLIERQEGERTTVIFLFSKEDTAAEHIRPLWPLPAFLQPPDIEQPVETNLPPLTRKKKETLPS